MSSLPLNTALPLRSPPPKRSSITQLESPAASGPLHASKDARQIIRLAQCPQCSYPLDEPVTLPCGNSICKKCIPELYLRQNITYPATENRLQGFTCPFPSCRKEHAAGDCCVDVVLNKVLSVVKSEINAYRDTPEASEVVLQLDERERWYIPGGAALRNTDTFKRVLTGGRLLSTFEMAELGSLQRDLEVTYTAVSGGDKAEALDTAVLEHLKETTRAELDCQVCYSLFLDPFTTPCGHTFCRKCLHRVLDHSNLCPVCRRVLAIPPGMTAQQAPSNVLLGKLLAGLCPEAVAARIETARIEDQVGVGDLDTSLFVCTLSFPSVPTFLHIFEPRYRLMIRRAIETGNRKFGMLLHNPSRSVQGDLGAVPFYQYGTLLHIINMHLMDDGRSIIETVGISRFRVLRHGTLDGYSVGKIERVDDMTLAEEEALEAVETTEVNQRQPTTREPQRSHTGEDLMGMSTQELMGIGTTFVKTMREQSAPWLHRRVFQAFGECPEDPAIFPWWFASVLPIADGEKYKLLSTSSVRERLKICAGWVAQLEARRRQTRDSSCTVI